MKNTLGGDGQIWLAAIIVVTAFGLALDGWLTDRIEAKRRKEQKDRQKARKTPPATTGAVGEDPGES